MVFVCIENEQDYIKFKSSNLLCYIGRFNIMGELFFSVFLFVSNMGIN